MFIATLFSVAKTLKQPMYHLVGQWLHTYFTYATIKRNKILKNITASLNYQKIMLKKKNPKMLEFDSICIKLLK